MRWPWNRIRYSDTDPRQVEFYFAQYIELMKHGRDRCDEAMKAYVANVITELGVPDGIILEDVEELPEPPRSNPIIVRHNKKAIDYDGNNHDD